MIYIIIFLAFTSIYLIALEIYEFVTIKQFNDPILFPSRDTTINLIVAEIVWALKNNVKSLMYDQLPSDLIIDNTVATIISERVSKTIPCVLIFTPQNNKMEIKLRKDDVQA